MLTKLHPVDLARRLCQIGPYVLFCNAECEGKNQELIKYIYEMNYTLKNISFLELKWEEYKKFKGIKSDNEMNHIYAYFKGEISISESNPTKENLFYFFKKCVELYNNKIDCKIHNIGIRNKNIAKCGNIIEELERKNIYIYNKLKLLKKKINVSGTKKIKYSKKEINWYKDVKYNELPFSILDENSISDYSKIDENDIKKLDDKCFNISYNVEKVFKRGDIKTIILKKYQSNGVSQFKSFENHLNKHYIENKGNYKIFK